VAFSERLAGVRALTLPFVRGNFIVSALTRSHGRRFRKPSKVNPSHVLRNRRRCPAGQTLNGNFTLRTLIDQFDGVEDSRIIMGAKPEDRTWERIGRD